jgi:predicted nuclease of restriction endonuclease-like RecB superfamily
MFGQILLDYNESLTQIILSSKLVRKLAKLLQLFKKTEFKSDINCNYLKTRPNLFACEQYIC